jgi:uncharacterized protein (TIGR03086 family)
MSDVAERYRRVAAAFTDRARAVPDGAWGNPSPCEGWTARDVVRHMVEWMPAFLESGAGVALPAGPPVDDDPVGAWLTVSDGIQALLDDPDTPSRDFVNEHTGRHPLDEAISMFILGDVLVHTWDLARATGLDETLDTAEVHAMLVGIEPMGDALSQSGQYGRPVMVPDDASEQTRLLAFTGRTP